MIPSNVIENIKLKICILGEVEAKIVMYSKRNESSITEPKCLFLLKLFQINRKPTLSSTRTCMVIWMLITVKQR